MSKNLIGKKVRIISDNENYKRFKNETLQIIFASNSGMGYDSTCYPQMLCDLGSGLDKAKGEGMLLVIDKLAIYFKSDVSEAIPKTEKCNHDDGALCVHCSPYPMI